LHVWGNFWMDGAESDFILVGLMGNWVKICFDSIIMMDGWKVGLF